MIYHGDCLEVLKTLPDNSVDALVTDPPAGISFMGKEWDHHKGGRLEWIKWMSSVMHECLRVMKPGAHGLVWALPRTSHWTATALEDAGFEIRDVITHLFGQGFPKSHNLEKACGAKGQGTALKPASEHWILIRKPISEKTIAENVLKWGCGGLNIDGCRIGTEAMPSGGSIPDIRANNYENSHGKTRLKTEIVVKQGRFPANLVLSHSSHCTDEACHMFECPVVLLDEQTKDTRAGKPSGSFSCRPKRETIPGSAKAIEDRGELQKHEGYESGPVSGASRFFYCAKISPSERGKDNKHPTVKPQKLMRYLCRLVTPPAGVILDPFMGSGSTGLAAKSEGFQFIGIEKEEEYVKIAEARIR